MVRPSQLLFAQRAPVTPRPAATVLLLRDGAQGLEVLMTRRSLQATFSPGAYVFPGGAIDPADAAAQGHAHRRPGQDDTQLMQAVAAIRESFEEVGVLLARRADGRMADASVLAQLDRRAPLPAQCARLGLQLAADTVHLLAHWTTDRDLPKRFDVPFLVARMPEGQEPVADDTEQFEPVWVRPADALRRHAEGGFLLIFPTIRTLQRLQSHGDVDSVLAACAASDGPLWRSCPRAGFLRGEEARFMEHEHPYGELHLVSPDGQMVHHLDWRTDQPVRLLKNVLRLTAPNPGAMTGPGTNSYLVGDADTGYLAIDPGPDDAGHVQRLWEAAGGDIRHIVCTHSHQDHSPGAKLLQALCTGAPPPIWGLPSADTALPASFFRPDRVLEDGQVLVLASPDGDPRHSLQAVHTPGHAANHLCLLLQEDALLFSGDHILNGSTTVVSPPDGHMTRYLESLDRLLALVEAQGVEFILPAHGYVLGQAAGVIRHLHAHRLRREDKVRAAMQALPQGSLDDWLPLVYEDTPKKLWPVARRSLQAHVDRLLALAAGESPVGAAR